VFGIYEFGWEGTLDEWIVCKFTKVAKDYIFKN
jgi:hypothetical protein